MKSTEAKTYEVMELYGEQVQRLIEKDDKPLYAKGCGQGRRKDPEDYRQAQERIRRRSQKARKKEEKDREEDRQFVREIADAYNFKLVGTEC